MKKRTIWRNLFFIGLWLVVGVFAIALLMPNRRAAPDSTSMANSDVPPLDTASSIDDAPAPRFDMAESTTAGNAPPFDNDSSANSGPIFAAPGAAAPAEDLAMGSESYQPGAAYNDANEEAGSAALDTPGEPAPAEPAAAAPSSTVGDADAIDEPTELGSSQQTYGAIGLSGTGEGGGGSGDGIGLGNFGTLGHGSGLEEGSSGGSANGAAAEDPQTYEIVVDNTAKPPLPPDATISASDDAMSEVDRQLAALPIGNIAFNTPESIPLGNTATIELLVSMKEAEEALRQAVHGLGPVETAHDIKLSDQMEAKVTGLGFRIEAITPERQAVSHTQETKWRWQIEPTKSNALELNLTLSALIKIGGEPSARAIRTFEKTIFVNVPLGQRITTAVTNNFKQITTVVLIPVVGGTWRYVRNRKRRQSPSPDEAQPSRRAA